MPNGFDQAPQEAAMPALLLVEDNALHVRLVRSMLEEVWYGDGSLVHVTRLDQALDYLTENNVDCVLLDLNLPDSDGLDGVVAVHNVAPNTPIVVLSAHDDEATALRAIGSGAEDYLVKGTVTADGVARAIQFAIQRHSSRPRARGRRDDRVSGRRHGIAVLDVDGNVVQGDAGFAAILGEPASGQGPTALIAHQDHSRWLEALLGTSREPVEVDVHIVDAHGTSVPINAIVAQLSDESGDATGYAAYLRVVDAVSDEGPAKPFATASTWIS